MPKGDYLRAKVCLNKRCGDVCRINARIRLCGSCRAAAIAGALGFAVVDLVAFMVWGR